MSCARKANVTTPRVYGFGSGPPRTVYGGIFQPVRPAIEDAHRVFVFCLASSRRVFEWACSVVGTALLASLHERHDRHRSVRLFPCGRPQNHRLLSGPGHSAPPRAGDVLPFSSTTCLRCDFGDSPPSRLAAASVGGKPSRMAAIAVKPRTRTPKLSSNAYRPACLTLRESVGSSRAGRPKNTLHPHGPSAATRPDGAGGTGRVFNRVTGTYYVSRALVNRASSLPRIQPHASPDQIPCVSPVSVDSRVSSHERNHQKKP